MEDGTCVSEGMLVERAQVGSIHGRFRAIIRMGNVCFDREEVTFLLFGMCRLQGDFSFPI